MADKDQEKGKWLLLRSGDHKAFAEFVDKYKQTVFLCCRTLGLKEDEAEDVASETFLAAYNKINRYRGQAELGTWLWKIAYCQGISYLRKNNRRDELFDELNAKVANTKEPGPVAILQGKEKEQFVWEAVRRLPRLWALAVILYYREGKSAKDIANIMRTRQNTVKTYLFRARERLRAHLTNVLGEDIDVGG